MLDNENELNMNEDSYTNHTNKLKSNLYKNKLNIVNELFGSVPNTMTLEKAKEEKQLYYDSQEN